MGRMLDALKALDARTPANPTAPDTERMAEASAVQEPAAVLPTVPPEIPSPVRIVETNWDQVLDDATALVDDAVEQFGLPPLVTEDPLDLVPAAPLSNLEMQPAAAQIPTSGQAAPLRRASGHAPPFETCTLPIAGEPADYYLEAATRICDQGANNYSNVLLFVSADRGSDESFSMPELAQAFAFQLAGDVLLIDGDLRQGRLSKQVSRPGAGMVEAMLGRAQWPDLIHPTNVARIDFVARGTGQVPTFERPQFGWSALRPLYRAVLIGPASQAEPETLWLAARCDAVYFVLSRLHTRRSNATTAVNALRAAGANVAGCIVVND